MKEWIIIVFVNSIGLDGWMISSYTHFYTSFYVHAPNII